MKIYLAGGINGLTEEQAFGWRKRVTALLKPLGVQCLNPIKSEDFNKFSTGGKFNEGDMTCYWKDKFDVKRADIVIVNMENTKSYGTIVEIGWASALGKLIIVINPKGITHPFIIAEAIQVETLEQAVELIKEML
jgi:nucleoside 2-deoxyribosyltransferase